MEILRGHILSFMASTYPQVSPQDPLSENAERDRSIGGKNLYQDSCDECLGHCQHHFRCGHIMS